MDIEKLRRMKRPEPGDDDPSPFESLAWEAAKKVFHGIDVGARLGGLGAGTAMALRPSQIASSALRRLLPESPSRGWIPDPFNIPEASLAFFEDARQGEISSGIEAYQDAMEAGKFYWGMSELAGSMLPTGAPFAIGGKIISKAPGIAGGISRLAPQAIRPGVETGLESTIKGVGQVLRAPWQAEEAVGRAVARPFVAGYRWLRPAAEAGKDIGGTLVQEPWKITRAEFRRPTGGGRQLETNEYIRTRTGANTPQELLRYYQDKYPELAGVKLGGLRSTKESGPLVNDGATKLVFDDGKFNPSASRIYLTKDADLAVARHEIEHLLDAIHNFRAKGQEFGRYGHEEFNASDYLHRSLVRDALVEGKPVPYEVLRDYSDLIRTAAPSRQIAAAAMEDMVYDQKVLGAATNTVSFARADTISKGAGLADMVNDPEKLFAHAERNPTVTLWHGTNVQGARGIINSGILGGDVSKTGFTAFGSGINFTPQSARKYAGGARGSPGDTNKIILQFEIPSSDLREFVVDVGGEGWVRAGDRFDVPLRIDKSKIKILYGDELMTGPWRQPAGIPRDLLEGISPTVAPVRQELIPDYPPTGPERYTKEWQFGASPYEGRGVRETGVPLRDGRDVPNDLNTPEGLWREINHINLLIKDNQITKRKAEGVGGRYKNREKVKSYDREIARRTAQRDELQKRLDQITGLQSAQRELLEYRQQVPFTERERLILELPKELEAARPKIYQEEFQKALNETIESGVFPLPRKRTRKQQIEGTPVRPLTYSDYGTWQLRKGWEEDAVNELSYKDLVPDHPALRHPLEEADYWDLKLRSPDVDYYGIEEKALQATEVRLRNMQIELERKLPTQQAGEFIGTDYQPISSTMPGYVPPVQAKVQPAKVVGPEQPPKGPPSGPGRALALVDEARPDALPQLQNMDEAINIATRSNLGRKVANLPGIRTILKRLNPSAIRNTIEGRGIIGLHILRFEGRQKTDLIFARLASIGTQKNVFGVLDSKGLLAEGPFKGRALNDIRANWEKPEINNRLTEQQRNWIKAAQKLEEEKLAFLNANGIKIHELTFKDGGHYAGRRVMGKFDPEQNLIDWGYAPGPNYRKGQRLKEEQERSWKNVEDAIRDGYRYLDEDEALYINIQAAYKKVAEKKFAEWILQNSPNISFLAKGKVREAEQVSASGITKAARDSRKAVFIGSDAEAIKKTVMAELDPVLAKWPLTAIGKANAVGRFMQLNGDASQFLIQLLYMTGTRGGMSAWRGSIKGFVQTLGDTKYHSTMLNNNRELLERHHDLIISLSGTEYTEALNRGGLLHRLPWVGGKITQVLDPFARAFNGAMDTAGISLAQSMEAYLIKDKGGPLSAAQIADIDAYINEIRGLASSQRLGVSPTMQAIENNLLLAPRYNRAIAALLWDTVSDFGGIRGTEARRALRRSVFGLTAIGSAFSMLEYMRETNPRRWTPGGMAESVVDHINPASPTFFTWKVGNTNVGPGTKVRSLVKLAASVGTDPRSMFELSMENPFTRFGRGNLSPVISDAWDIFSGYNYMGEPTGFFDGWDEESVGEDFKKLGGEVLLPDIMPIWIQAVLLEGGTPSERVVRGAAEFVGGRAYPLSLRQKTVALAKESGYTVEFDPDPTKVGKPIQEWEDFTDEQLRRLEREHPELTDELMRRGEYAITRAERMEHEEQLFTTIETATTKYLTADPSSSAYRPKAAKAIIYGARSNFYDALYGTIWDEELQQWKGGLYGPREDSRIPEEGTAEWLQDRYRVMFEESRNEKDGKIDYNILNKLEAELWANMTPAQIERVLGDIRGLEEDFTEEAQALLNAGRYASSVRHTIDGQSVNYWEIEDLPWVREWISLDSGATLEQIEEYIDATYGEREDMRRGDTVYDNLKQSLARAERQDGVLGMRRLEFMRKTEALGPEWFLAMYASGNNFLLDEKIVEELMNKGLFDQVQNLPYDEMYVQSMMTRAGSR